MYNYDRSVVSGRSQLLLHGRTIGEKGQICNNYPRALGLPSRSILLRLKQGYLLYLTTVVKHCWWPNSSTDCHALCYQLLPWSTELCARNGNGEHAHKLAMGSTLHLYYLPVYNSALFAQAARLFAQRKPDQLLALATQPLLIAPALFRLILISRCAVTFVNPDVCLTASSPCTQVVLATGYSQCLPTVTLHWRTLIS